MGFPNDLWRQGLTSALKILKEDCDVGSGYFRPLLGGGVPDRVGRPGPGSGSVPPRGARLRPLMEAAPQGVLPYPAGQAPLRPSVSRTGRRQDGHAVHVPFRGRDRRIPIPRHPARQTPRRTDPAGSLQPRAYQGVVRGGPPRAHAARRCHRDPGEEVAVDRLPADRRRSPPGGGRRPTGIRADRRIGAPRDSRGKSRGFGGQVGPVARAEGQAREGGGTSRRGSGPRGPRPEAGREARF